MGHDLFVQSINISLYSPIYLYASSLSLYIFINSKTIYNDSLYLNLLWILSACLCLQENQSVRGTEHSCNKEKEIKQTVKYDVFSPEGKVEASSQSPKVAHAGNALI